MGAVLVTALIVVLVVLTNFPRILAAVGGLQPLGSVAGVFTQPAIAAPNPAVRNVGQSFGATLNAQEFGNIPINVGRLDVGQDNAGNPVAVLALSESDLNTLCRRESAICSPAGTSQVRGAQFDLRPNGLVVTAEFRIPQTGLWQQGGVVILFDSTRGEFSLAGLEIDDTLYGVPDEITALRDLDRAGNALLERVTLQAEGRFFRISQIYADENRITFILR